MKYLLIVQKQIQRTFINLTNKNCFYMKTTEQWVIEKVLAYNKNPKETLEEMLLTTTDVIDQYVKSQNNSTKGVLDDCLKHNKLFLQYLAKNSFVNVKESTFAETLDYVENVLFPPEVPKFINNPRRG